MKKDKECCKSDAKHKALEKRTKEGDKMHKTHSSTEYCRHCGKKVRSSTTHESGHREFDHVDTPGYHGEKIVR